MSVILDGTHGSLIGSDNITVPESLFEFIKEDYVAQCILSHYINQLFQGNKR